MVDQSCFLTNDDAIFAGLELVKQLFSRFARLQTNMTPDPDDDFLNHHLDTWFEIVLKSCEAGVHMPFADLANVDGMTQNEIYIILILLSIHFEIGLKEACAALRGHAMLQAPSPSLLINLLFPSGVQKIHLYKSGQLPVIFDDKRYVILRHDASSPFEEPSVFLAPKCLQRLLDLYAPPETTKTYWGKYYRMESPQSTPFICNTDLKSEILTICRQYTLTPVESALFFLVYGRPGSGKHTLARDMACQLNQPLCTLNVAQIMAQADDVHHISHILNEIEKLGAILLMPDIHDLMRASSVIRVALLDALKAFHGIGIFTCLSNRDIDPELQALTIKTIELPGLNQAERMMMWQKQLDGVHSALSQDDIKRIATQYLFHGGQIMHAFHVAKLLSNAIHAPAIMRETIERACHFVLQKTFDGLAVSTKSEGAALDRLILPDKQHETFMSILSAARSRDKVMIEWGFGSRLVTGRGLCILFDGPPGTGKTFAAEVLANALNRPLERVHLPNLVSKWVGETGENLAKLFAAATAANAILLLDEADALLSKRVSSGSQSSDRYANMEINILLQEIERFNGISILTTNLEKSLDEALERRVQYRITFVKPNPVEREKLWRTLMSPKAPTEDGIDYAALAKDFDLAGGHIKNAILNAAYRACGENRAICERDLREAATAECAKQGLLIKN